VGELSKAGLVERREDERDRRRTIVSLTEEIRKIAEPRIQEHLQPFKRTLERLSPAARNSLHGGHARAQRRGGRFRTGQGPGLLTSRLGLARELPGAQQCRT